MTKDVFNRLSEHKGAALSHMPALISVLNAHVLFFTRSWSGAIFNYCLADIDMFAASFVVLRVKPAKKLDLFGAFYFYLCFDRV